MRHKPAKPGPTAPKRPSRAKIINKEMQELRDSLGRGRKVLQNFNQLIRESIDQPPMEVVQIARREYDEILASRENAARRLETLLGAGRQRDEFTALLESSRDVLGSVRDRVEHFLSRAAGHKTDEE